MALRPEHGLRAYRIADARHPIFDGGGAAQYGGRWNSPGRWVIYAAETFAGAMLEQLAHANIGRIPRNQRFVTIDIPAGVAVEAVDPTDVPGWDAMDRIASRAHGDAWYDEQRSAVLLVPSLVTRVERNVLINQRHPHFARIAASEPQPVVWDDRLFRD